jgi:hypothetical protein
MCFVCHELGFYIPEDDSLHSHRCENLKSHKILCYLHISLEIIFQLVYLEHMLPARFIQKYFKYKFSFFSILYLLVYSHQVKCPISETSPLQYTVKVAHELRFNPVSCIHWDYFLTQADNSPFASRLFCHSVFCNRLPVRYYMSSRNQI